MRTSISIVLTPTRELTTKKISPYGFTGSSISCSIHRSHSKLKLVTWVGVRYCEVELRHINNSTDWWCSPTGDIVELHSVPDVRVHSSDVQREGRAPGESDNILPRKRH